jgi:hypothetical protein
MIGVYFPEAFVIEIAAVPFEKRWHQDRNALFCAKDTMDVQTRNSVRHQGRDLVQIARSQRYILMFVYLVPSLISV